MPGTRNAGWYPLVGVGGASTTPLDPWVQGAGHSRWTDVHEGVNTAARSSLVPTFTQQGGWDAPPLAALPAGEVQSSQRSRHAYTCSCFAVVMPRRSGCTLLSAGHRLLKAPPCPACLGCNSNPVAHLASKCILRKAKFLNVRVQCRVGPPC